MLGTLSVRIVQFNKYLQIFNTILSIKGCSQNNCNVIFIDNDFSTEKIDNLVFPEQEYVIFNLDNSIVISVSSDGTKSKSLGNQWYVITLNNHVVTKNNKTIVYTPGGETTVEYFPKTNTYQLSSNASDVYYKVQAYLNKPNIYLYLLIFIIILLVIIGVIILIKHK